MDIQMPLLGGMEATRGILDLEKLRGVHTPIIAMTAHAVTGDANKCCKPAWMNTFQNPFEPNF